MKKIIWACCWRKNPLFKECENCDGRDLNKECNDYRGREMITVEDLKHGETKK